MIAILNNLFSSLISSLMLPMGFALDNLILLLKNPAGFVFVFSSISFFEYSTAKSIISDFSGAKTKKGNKKLPKSQLVTYNMPGL